MVLPVNRNGSAIGFCPDLPIIVVFLSKCFVSCLILEINNTTASCYDLPIEIVIVSIFVSSLLIFRWRCVPCVSP